MLTNNVIELLRPDVDTETKLTGVSLYLVRQLEQTDARLDTVEIKTLVPVKDGERGQIGPRGLDGKPGRDGLDGKNGKDGVDGKVGPKGKEGVSVVNSEIDVDGHLVLELSNGKIIDAGDIVQESTKRVHTTVLARPQIIVSTTAPPNPQPNDLWYDIS